MGGLVGRLGRRTDRRTIDLIAGSNPSAERTGGRRCRLERRLDDVATVARSFCQHDDGRVMTS